MWNILNRTFPARSNAGFLLILGIVLFSGCVVSDKQIQKEQPESTPNFPLQPTATAAPHVEENISKNPYLFFEVYLLPPENYGERITRECSPLWASYVDFPTYYFNESEKRLYPNAPPGAYDFIKFNESLMAIAGVGLIGYNSGISSQLEPIYGLPYSSIGQRVPVPNYWTYIDEFGKVQITNITDGMLVVNFDNQTVKIVQGDVWTKQIRQCGERIRIVNHGFLTGGLG
ncbi:MAG TPA: hypothetical protein VIO58_11420 [Candidatus Methanoperedens sp.]